MTNSRALLGLLAGITLCAAPVLRADQFESVREKIRDTLIEQDLPSITVAVARDGKSIWEEGFGWADVERRIAATADTVYSLASISKPFTTSAIMVLAERGQIALDAPIERYLGGIRLVAHVGDSSEATVRRIGDHTSGLAEYYRFFYEDEKVKPPSLEESIRRNAVLVARPGEAMVYSNFGYALLEYAIERSSGKTYAQFMRDEIFQPLGLAHSGVNREPDFERQYAVRYSPNGAPVPFYDFDHRAASAVFSSAHDLLRFGMFHLKNRLPGQKRVLTDRSLDEMHRATAKDEGDDGYGFGWATSKRNGLATVEHGGYMAGVHTQLTLLPEQNIAIVVLSNSQARDITAIENAIVHALLPQTIRVAHGFKPEPQFIGTWKGAIDTQSARTAMTLTIEPTGRVLARIGSADEREVEQVSLGENGLLHLEEVPGNVGPGAAGGYAYRMSFTLRARGAELNGAASASARPVAGRIGNLIAYYVELKKQ